MERLYPDFEHRDADTLAARVRKDLETYREELEEIRSVPLESATFGNTVLALEQAGRALDVSSATFYNLLSCDADDRLMELSEELTEELTDVANEISLDPDIAAKVKKIYEAPQDALSRIDKRLLLRTYESYRDNGSMLPESSRQELKGLRKELSLATLRFGQNVLREQNAYRLSVLDGESLKRLPSSALEQARKRAKEEGVEGWIFDLSMPSYSALMRFCSNRETRKQIYRDRGTLCYDPSRETSNIATIYDIVRLRHSIAKLLGHETYAELVLTKKMAKTPDAVYSMLDKLRDAYLAKAREEVETIAGQAERRDQISTLEPWDWSYYAELYREKALKYEEEQTRPYFELSSVVEAMFGLTGKLYGIELRRNGELPVYHPDVEAYDVLREGQLLGTLLLDYFPRKGKRSGAWMTNYVEEYEGVRPVISLVTNFTPPSDEKPSLLTFDETTTLFHEFGHALHGLLTTVKHASLSGTNVEHDFVELPSQMNENWMRQRDFVKSFAKHYETGEVIGDDLLDAIERNALFLDGYGCIRQLTFGYLDMKWHATDPETLPTDIEEVEAEAQKGLELLPHAVGTAMSPSFTHIFSGGYAAGYYGYKWSEILDADAFEEFIHNGLTDRATSDRFRENILERGDSEDPAELYRAFKGRDATVDALLRRSHLIQ
ncbi:MAG: M3 family metallopeptidase [Porphyromonas sp.]|uniref:M3 family metallopeptidase n=1 Tax=Porphyromonas sp. TaxID=1924944 RepID=UPI002A91A4EB|nr:M3 family metallopeptidase [Porphyromonas sp.]MDD7468584.1 M3 family metallopeptidase [Bacteroidales bacterium]MDY6101958.1 M3 family metallopeptidase [Porphyromonas sp.]